jgi:tight adherence protein B
MRTGDVLRQLVALISSGLPARQAQQTLQSQLDSLAPAEAKQFQLIWQLALRVGGPIVLALTRLAQVFDRAEANSREAALAFAAPQATARLVMWLPAIALLLGQLVGLNPIGSIMHSLLAALSVCLGVGLLVAGSWWSKRLLAKANLQHEDPGAFLDCVVIGLHAGLPVDVAAKTAAASLVEFELSSTSAESNEALAGSVELSRSTGAAITELLISSADRLRENLRFESATLIAKLGVRLMIPLGVTVLPAFVLLSIVPIAIGLLSNQGGT